MKNIYLILVMIFSLTIFIPTISKATTIDDVITSADSFLKSGNGQITINKEELQDTSSDIYNILLYIGIAGSVIVGTILGIEFMISSAEDKAKVKEALIPYIVGCFIIFGAFGIWKIAISIFTALDN